MKGSKHSSIQSVTSKSLCKAIPTPGTELEVPMNKLNIKLFCRVQKFQSLSLTAFLSRVKESRHGISAVLTVFLLAKATLSFAIIPEPDNILYGSITLDNLPVTASMTNVIIEARRSTNGPALASYRMGSDEQSGNFYSLRLSLESIAPIKDANASQTGDTLFILLRDESGIRSQTNFTIVERGVVQRIDFGLAVADGDGDGLPDLWELYRFGGLGQGPGTLTLNGQTVVQHFIAGTDPNDPNGGFRLSIARTNPLKRVWFNAARAEGPGYDGMTRVYTLQFRPVLSGGFWSDVPGYINIVGTNQTVNYFTAAGGTGYYRGCISLLGFNLPGSGSGPLLTIARLSSNTARVSWPSPSTGFLLQENPNLNPTNWSLSSASVNEDGTFKFVIVNSAGANRFYRLMKSQ
jgi:hypothetical protein